MDGALTWRKTKQIYNRPQVAKFVRDILTIYECSDPQSLQQLHKRNS